MNILTRKLIFFFGKIGAKIDFFPFGKKIELDDLTWVRPGTGMPIGEEFLLIGNSANRKISQGELMSLDMIN